MIARLASGCLVLSAVPVRIPTRGADSSVGLKTWVMDVGGLNRKNKPSDSLSCSSSALIFSKGSVSGARGRPSTGSYVHSGSVG